MRKLQSQGVHHITIVGADRQTSIDFWEGLLGMPFVFEQPNPRRAGDPAQRRQGPRLHGLDLIREPARPADRARVVPLRAAEVAACVNGVVRAPDSRCLPRGGQTLSGGVAWSSREILPTYAEGNRSRPWTLTSRPQAGHRWGVAAPAPGTEPAKARKNAQRSQTA